MDYKRLTEIGAWSMQKKNSDNWCNIDQPLYKVVLVGVGGTGGLLLENLCRLSLEAKTLRREMYNKKYGDAPDSPVMGLDITIFDPDEVEEKNLLRQNFCKRDVGKPKAQVLAERYTAVFGESIGYKVDRFTGNGVALDLIITCVDNHKSRALFSAHGPVYHAWIDAGNELTNGQVFISGKFYKKCRMKDDEMQPAYKTVYLDKDGSTRFYWSEIQSELLDSHPRIGDLAERPEKPRSCADDLVTGEQSFAVNLMSAQIITNIVSSMIRRQDIPYYEVRFDTQSNIEKRYVADYVEDERRAHMECEKLRKLEVPPETEKPYVPPPPVFSR